MNKNDELYFERLKLYMKAKKYEVDTTLLYKTYIQSYTAEQIKEIVFNRNSNLNNTIDELESIIRNMQPNRYTNEEVMEPLLEAKQILYSYKLVKRDLNDYIINSNCSDTL